MNRYYDQLSPEMKEVLQQTQVEFHPVIDDLGGLPVRSTEQLIQWLKKVHPEAYKEYVSSIAMKRHVEVRNKNHGGRSRHRPPKR